MQTLESLNRKAVDEETLTVTELKALLNSRFVDYKNNAIDIIESKGLKVLTPEIVALTNDRNELIASNALDCLHSLNSDKALVEAVKHIDDKRRFVQASSLYVLSCKGSRRHLQPVKQAADRWKKNLWRRVSFLETLYILEKDSMHLKELFSILFRTNDYRTQCSIFNVLNNICNKSNFESIKKSIVQFVKKHNFLPVSVKSTVDRVLREISEQQERME